MGASSGEAASRETREKRAAAHRLAPLSHARGHFRSTRFARRTKIKESLLVE